MIVRAALFVSSVLLASSAAIAAATPAPTGAAKPAPAATTAPATPQSSDCAGSHDVDRCLVGTWEMSVDGPAEWIRTHLKSAKTKITSHVGNKVTFNADGTFATGTAQTQATADSATMHTESNMTSQASGRWSAAGGKLNYCTTSLHQEGQTKVVVGGKTTVIPTKVNGPSTTSQAYTCAGDTFTQTVQMRSGDMTSTFKKVH